MEFFNVEHIEWSETAPTEPGLYLFMAQKESINDYPIIHLVGINYDNSLHALLADSDTWETWLDLSYFCAGNPGQWSKRICFTQQ